MSDTLYPTNCAALHNNWCKNNRFNVAPNRIANTHSSIRFSEKLNIEIRIFRMKLKTHDYSNHRDPYEFPARPIDF